MPFALLIIGMVLIVAGVRNTTPQLFQLVKGDFTSQGVGKESFVAWFIAILAVGSAGYVEELRPLSRAFLVLLIVVLFLSNGGFFRLFNLQALGTTAEQQPQVASFLQAGDIASAMELQPTMLQTTQPMQTAMILQ